MDGRTKGWREGQYIEREDNIMGGGTNNGREDDRSDGETKVLE